MLSLTPMEKPKNLRDLYLGTRAHLLAQAAPAVLIGRPSLHGEGGRRSPVGRLLGPEAAVKFRWAAYMDHVRTPLTASVDEALGRELSRPEREFLARAERAHDLFPARRWPALLDDAYAVAATRRY